MLGVESGARHRLTAGLAVFVLVSANPAEAAAGFPRRPQLDAAKARTLVLADRCERDLAGVKTASRSCYEFRDSAAGYLGRLAARSQWCGEIDRRRAEPIARGESGEPRGEGCPMRLDDDAALDRLEPVDSRIGLPFKRPPVP
jgi:hypothetical protein